MPVYATAGLQTLCELSDWFHLHQWTDDDDDDDDDAGDIWQDTMSDANYLPTREAIHITTANVYWKQ